MCRHSRPPLSPTCWSIFVGGWREWSPMPRKSGPCPVVLRPAEDAAQLTPIQSFLPPATRRRGRGAFARAFRAARGGEAADPRHAQAAYRAILSRRPGFSEAHYRLAQLLERDGGW